LTRKGRLTICSATATAASVRIEKNGLTTVLADHYNGKRLKLGESISSVAAMARWFFTDPPFGLPKGHMTRAARLHSPGLFRP